MILTCERRSNSLSCPRTLAVRISSCLTKETSAMEQLSALGYLLATSPLPTLMTFTAPSSPAVAALPDRQERPLQEYLKTYRSLIAMSVPIWKLVNGERRWLLQEVLFTFSKFLQFQSSIKLSMKHWKRPNATLMMISI